LRINPYPRGNRKGMTGNPATERRCAQGMLEYEEVLRTVRKPPSDVAQPAYKPGGRDRCASFSSERGNITPGEINPGGIPTV